MDEPTYIYVIHDNYEMRTPKIARATVVKQTAKRLTVSHKGGDDAHAFRWATNIEGKHLAEVEYTMRGAWVRYMDALRRKVDIRERQNEQYRDQMKHAALAIKNIDEEG